MTAGYRSLTVMLEREMSEEDAASLIAAIDHFRGVARVHGNTGAQTLVMAKASHRQRVLEGLTEIVGQMTRGMTPAP